MILPFLTVFADPMYLQSFLWLLGRYQAQRAMLSFCCTLMLRGFGREEENSTLCACVEIERKAHPVTRRKQ